MTQNILSISDFIENANVRIPQHLYINQVERRPLDMKKVLTKMYTPV